MPRPRAPALTRCTSWAYPLSGGSATFLGVATYGGVRPDVAAVHGDQFRASGFGLNIQGLPPGSYDLAVFPCEQRLRRLRAREGRKGDRAIGLVFRKKAPADPRRSRGSQECSEPDVPNRGRIIASRSPAMTLHRDGAARCFTEVHRSRDAPIVRRWRSVNCRTPQAFREAFDRCHRTTLERKEIRFQRTSIDSSRHRKRNLAPEVIATPPGVRYSQGVHSAASPSVPGPSQRAENKICGGRGGQCAKWQ